jgi:hypothetical protein
MFRRQRHSQEHDAKTRHSGHEKKKILTKEYGERAWCRDGDLTNKSSKDKGAAKIFFKKKKKDASRDGITLLVPSRGQRESKSRQGDWSKKRVRKRMHTNQKTPRHTSFPAKL